MRHALPLIVAVLAGACNRQAPEAAPPPGATPVRLGEVSRADLRETVSAPGRTVAQRVQIIRAPFDGVLVRLTVTDGDRVVPGQVLGEVVAQSSQGAVDGARAMLASARTDRDRAEAQRALAVAEANRVVRRLTAPAGGVVASHQAAEGDLLGAHADVLSIADDRAVVFIADLPQTNLPKVRPGGLVELSLDARPGPIKGVVAAIVPSGADRVTPVRVTPVEGARLAPELFGTARFVVATHAGVLAVPSAALLKDDLTGVARIAVVKGGKAHWIEVRPGLEDDGRVELRAPALEVGTPVIVEGQVGLPEAATVEPAP